MSNTASPSVLAPARMRAAVALALVTGLAAGCATTGAIQGRVRFPAQSGRSHQASGKTGTVRGFARADAVIMAWPQGAPPRASGRRATVVHSRGRFLPRVLTVPVGTTIVFENRDRVYHNAFSVSPDQRFDLGKYSPGERRETRLHQPGVVQVFCDLHPEETAYLVVAPSRWITRPRADGGFALSGMPPGTYTVRAWHPTLGDRVQRVRVSADARANVHFAF